MEAAVAAGTLPVPGEDARFDPLIQEISDRAPKVNADGLIDYREHGGICLVEPGTPLMRRTPAEPAPLTDSERARVRQLLES